MKFFDLIYLIYEWKKMNIKYKNKIRNQIMQKNEASIFLWMMCVYVKNNWKTYINVSNFYYFHTDLLFTLKIYSGAILKIQIKLCGENLSKNRKK